MHRRLSRRTARVRAAWPAPAALAEARDQLLIEEASEVLFAAVKVCPFAGYLDDTRRIGCLLHPTRHPTGADLRDLAVYPKEVCAGHFCASHDWLRPREADLAQAGTGLPASNQLYGRVVTDAGLVKAVGRALDDALGRCWGGADLGAATTELTALWTLLLLQWPWVDADPRRFGGFFFDGDDAIERSLPSAFFGLTLPVSAAERIIVDAIGTRPLDTAAAAEALTLLRSHVSAVAGAMGLRVARR